jgi:hypothetical protein
MATVKLRQVDICRVANRIKVDGFAVGIVKVGVKPYQCGGVKVGQ